MVALCYLQKVKHLRLLTHIIRISESSKILLINLEKIDIEVLLLFNTVATAPDKL